MSALPTAWPSINSGVDARRFLGGATDTVETKWHEEYLEMTIRVKPINDEIAGGGRQGEARLSENQVFRNYRRFAYLNDFGTVAPAYVAGISFTANFLSLPERLICQRDRVLFALRDVYERLNAPAFNSIFARRTRQRELTNSGHTFRGQLMRTPLFNTSNYGRRYPRAMSSARRLIRRSTFRAINA